MNNNSPPSTNNIVDELNHKPSATSTDRAHAHHHSDTQPWAEDPAQMTCDVLCSLSRMNCHTKNGNSNSSSHNMNMDDCHDDGVDSTGSSGGEKLRGGSKACPKQHQLPLFLSKTYHMIDRCEPSIATWASGGDNFVVKNVEKFASTVLPKYFKHSNFSSFARQLNFYGFRKLRTDPIINTDVDPRTACHVRFYHENFQRDRPELLHHIKRATKSDQQSKDDVESLRMEIMKLKDCIAGITSDFDRKLAEMSYEYNRRISSMSAEFDKLAVLVQQHLLAQHHSQLQHAAGNGGGGGGEGSGAPGASSNSANTSALGHLPADMMHSLSQVAALSLQSHHAAAHAAHHHLRQPTLSALSNLTQQAAAAAAAAASSLHTVNSNNNNNNGGGGSGEKRSAEDDSPNAPASNRPRNG